MQINFHKEADGRLIICFEDQAINLEFSFQRATTITAEKIVQFKGLLHSRPLSGFVQRLTLDQEGLLTLVYTDGIFSVKMEHASTTVTLPIGKEVYSRLDYLLNQLIE